MNLITIITELASVLGWAVQNVGSWQTIITDVEAALNAATNNPPVFPPGSTPIQDFQILLAWGVQNEPLFAKVVQDILALVNVQKAAIARAATGHRAMMTCASPA